MRDKNTNGRSSTPSTSLITKTSTKKKNSKKKNVGQKNNVGFTQKLSAVLTRLMFISHASIALWRVSLVYDPFYLYFLSIGVALLLFEMIFTLAVRQGKEYKWFCPSVFFYLLSVVPCLWFLELARLDEYQKLPKISGGCLPITQLKGYNISVQEDLVLEIDKPQKRSIQNLDLNLLEITLTRNKRKTDDGKKIPRGGKKRKRRKNKNTESVTTTLPNLTTNRNNIKNDVPIRTTQNLTPITKSTTMGNKISNDPPYMSLGSSSVKTESVKATTVLATHSFPANATHTQTQMSTELPSTTLINNTNSLGKQPNQNTQYTTGENYVLMTDQKTFTKSQDTSDQSITEFQLSRTTTNLFDINHVATTETSTTSKIKPTTNPFDVIVNDVTTTKTDDVTARKNKVVTTRKTIHATKENVDDVTGANGSDVTTHKTGIQNLGDSITKFGENTLTLIQNTTMTVNAFLNLLDPENWLLALHQILLFVLVIGRWLLPKGEISRDQLSQLLLVFIGVGADILEFVTETFGDEEISVKCNLFLHYVIYGVWSWSLLQFTLVLTAVRSRKERVGFTDRVQQVPNSENCCTKNFFKHADLWAILVTLMLQDVPFLAFRLYMMIVYNQVQQMMIFFTGKNILVVFLQIYRIVVIQVEKKADNNDDIPDEELQPLRGTLLRLSAKARSVSQNETNVDGDIKNASFKSKKDGSVVVKIHLDGKNTKKR